MGSSRAGLVTRCIAIALLSCVAATAHAQRIVRIVVPYGAGAGAVQDTIARAISQEFGQALGATVVVENRAGAGGSVGAAQVARAAPDGNTLVLAAASHHIVGHLYPKLGYDPLRDFVGVGYLGSSGYVIVTSSSLPVTTIGEFVRELKANPGRYNYGSAGNGSATHLGMASFLARAGAQMVHVPMKSTGDAVNEVPAGRLQAVASATIGVIAFREDPRVRLLAYAGRTRSRFIPDVPTVDESGLKGFEYDSWIGLLAPAGTPQAEVDRQAAALEKVLASPAVQERFTRLGVELSSMSQPAFQKLLAADWERMGMIVKESGAKVE